MVQLDAHHGPAGDRAFYQLGVGERCRLQLAAGGAITEAAPKLGRERGGVERLCALQDPDFHDLVVARERAAKGAKLALLAQEPFCNGEHRAHQRLTVTFTAAHGEPAFLARLPLPARCIAQGGIGSVGRPRYFGPMPWLGISGWARRACVLAALLGYAACGGSSDSGAAVAGAAGANPGGANSAGASAASASAGSSAQGGDPSRAGAEHSAGATANGASPTIAGCALFPPNHLFNTAIDHLPTHGSSSDFMKAVGTRNIHLDLGVSLDPKSDEYYGIPYNVVHGNSMPWANASFTTTDTDNLDWDPTVEADCAAGDAHTLTSPCTKDKAPKPLFPIPATPLVEGGIDTDPAQPYADHHILLLDADTCTLWETYHSYPDPKGGWDIFGAAFFDLKVNTLRPAGWTSADAAGFPILPLLLRADEASSGTIKHALRFTIDSSKIRNEYTWPARHLTSNGTGSMTLPPMGQAFRIKSSYAIPSTFNTQSRAILQALKTYGMYLADGGSAMYIQGEPSAGWEEATFDQVQSVSSSNFEAVDLTEITRRAGFDPNSATVP